MVGMVDKVDMVGSSRSSSSTEAHVDDKVEQSRASHSWLRHYALRIYLQTGLDGGSTDDSERLDEDE